MLSIKNLKVTVNNKKIINGFNLEVKAGEVHAIMGPNGTGKSTLAATIAGKENYIVTEGEIIYKGKNLLDMPPEVRSREGIFLGFQYPVEIPGVSLTNFLKTAVNEHRKYKGLEPLSASDFLKLMDEKKKVVELQTKLTNRSVNEGFSGGEKKKMKFSRWPCLSRNSLYLMKPIPALTLMHFGSLQTVYRKCVQKTMLSLSLRIISAYLIILCLTLFM